MAWWVEDTATRSQPMHGARQILGGIRVKRVVSVSVGSSKRNKTVEQEILGEQFVIERIGTDGSFERAGDMIAELDGQTDAIGLGGCDLYLVAGGRRHVVRDAARLAARATTTPVVDGSGLKHTLERAAVRVLAERGMLHVDQALRGVKNLRVLITSAVDRFGMAEAFAEIGAQTIFGDLIFALGIPIPLRRLWQVRLAADALLPILVRQPFERLYPTGEKQHQSTPRFRKYYDWADIIAGDMHFINRYMPPAQLALKDLAGKTVLTNTTTEEDVENLRGRGLSRLITTTPRMDGRSFGTNVMEGVVVSLLGKPPDDITEADYLQILDRIGWEPNVMDLQEG